jgi:hypothetical protein
MSELDPVLAKALEGLSMQEIDAKIAANPDLHGFARMATFDPVRKPEQTATIRKLMNDFGAAKYCDNTRCIRAGECMTPKVRCFWQHFYVMQRVVFPAMRRKLKEMEARGEYVPGER